MNQNELSSGEAESSGSTECEYTSRIAVACSSRSCVDGLELCGAPRLRTRRTAMRNEKPTNRGRDFWPEQHLSVKKAHKHQHKSMRAHTGCMRAQQAKLLKGLADMQISLAPKTHGMIPKAPLSLSQQDSGHSDFRVPEEFNMAPCADPSSGCKAGMGRGRSGDMLVPVVANCVQSANPRFCQDPPSLTCHVTPFHAGTMPLQLDAPRRLHPQTPFSGLAPSPFSSMAAPDATRSTAPTPIESAWDLLQRLRHSRGDPHLADCPALQSAGMAAPASAHWHQPVPHLATMPSSNSADSTSAAFADWQQPVQRLTEMPSVHGVTAAAYQDWHQPVSLLFQPGQATPYPLTCPAVHLREGLRATDTLLDTAPGNQSYVDSGLVGTHSRDAACFTDSQGVARNVSSPARGGTLARLHRPLGPVVNTRLPAVWPDTHMPINTHSFLAQGLSTATLTAGQNDRDYCAPSGGQSLLMAHFDPSPSLLSMPHSLKPFYQ